MSEVRVNKLSPRSGTTVTLGDSGDTITIPSGVTLSNAGTNTFASATITGDLTVDTNTLKVDSTNNRVGIGTISPNRPLSVNGGGLNIVAAFESTDQYSFIDFKDGNTTTTFPPSLGADGNSLVLNTDNIERMRIDSSGNVGIGKSSPSQPLDVYGSAQISYSGANTYLYFESALNYIGRKTDGNLNINVNAGQNIISSIGGTESMRIDSYGNTLINSTTVYDPQSYVAGGSKFLQVKSTATDRASFLNLIGGGGGANHWMGGIYFSVNGQAYPGAEILSLTDSSSTSGVLRFYTSSNTAAAAPERMRIDSSGNVGIGTSSPNNQLEIKSDTATVVTRLACNTGSGRDWGVASNTDGAFGIYDYDATSYRMLIDSSGSILVGTTTDTPAQNNVNGVSIRRSGYPSEFTGEGGPVLQINRKANDGTLVSFRQDGTQEGSISVSGTTVSYNGFTGTHWSRFTDNLKPTILKGTVLESLDEMCDWYNLEFDVTDAEENTYTKKVSHVLQEGQSAGDTVTYNHEGTDYQATIVKEADMKHMKSKVSDTVDAKNVYGVFNAYDEDGEGYNDFYVASVGSFVVRIKANETIAKGDLLQSNGDGTAKVQTDDAVRSSSFAKVLSTTIIETYEDGSYLVPCSLMC